MPKDTFHNLPEEKRRRIVELAIEEFADHPFRQASLSRLCTRAGIAKGSMYQYFDNKLELYSWLITEEAGRRKLDFIAAHELEQQPEGFFEQLEATAFAGLRFAVENPRIGRMALALYEPTADPELRALHDSHRRLAQQHFRKMIEAAQGSGEIRTDVDPGIAANFVVTMLGQGLLNALLDHLDLSMHEFLEHPEFGQRITETEFRALIHNAIELLSRGLENEDKGTES